MAEDQVRFREQALTHLRLSRSYERPLRIVTSQGWLLLIMLALFLGGVVVWGMVGSIPTWVEGQGILLARESAVQSIVAQGEGGDIEELLVKAGEAVQEGQVIAKIRHRALEQDALERTTHLAYLKRNYETQVKDYEERLQGRLQDYEKQKKALEDLLKNQTTYFTFIEDLMKRRKELLDRKLIPISRYDESFQDYSQAKNQMEQTKISLIQAEGAVNEFRDHWKQRLLDLEMKMKETERDVQTLQERITLFSVVRAPSEGRIASLQKSKGNAVNQGETISTLTTSDEDLNAILYVPAELGKQIEAGMEAQVTPTFIKREEYGSIRGRVADVSDLPVNAKRIQAVLQNENLVRSFSEDKAPFEVRVTLEKNPKTTSGFAWTSSKGPDQTITLGTIVGARVVIKRQPPITLLVPALKKLFGVA